MIDMKISQTFLLDILGLPEALLLCNRSEHSGCSRLLPGTTVILPSLFLPDFVSVKIVDRNDRDLETFFPSHSSMRDAVLVSKYHPWPVVAYKIHQKKQT